MGVLVLALATVAVFIDEEVQNKAKQKIRDWFPNAIENELKEIDNKLKIEIE